MFAFSFLPLFSLFTTDVHQYFKLGICIFINGMFSQMSDTHVNGNVQSVLYQVRLYSMSCVCNLTLPFKQLAFPATGVLAWWMLKNRFTMINIVGSVLVLGGCLMVAVPPVCYRTRLLGRRDEFTLFQFFQPGSNGNSTIPTCYGNDETDSVVTTSMGVYADLW